MDGKMVHSWDGRALYIDACGGKGKEVLSIHIHKYFSGQNNVKLG